MEESSNQQLDEQKNAGIRRFNIHSVACMQLVSKMEKEFLRRSVGEGETLSKYLRLFRDTKDSYKVLSLVIEEIQADLSLANLQFVCYPYRKILTFHTSLNNTLLDAFAEVYDQLRQNQLKSSLSQTRQLNSCSENRKVNCVLIDEAQQARRRKQEFAQRQKINYLIQADLDDQDGEYLTQLNKILENKEVSKRYKIPTTAVEMQQVKDKMEDIVHFTDFISGENARFKTQQFVNLDLYRQSRQSIEQLTANIFGNFESSFRSKYIAAVKESGRQYAEQSIKNTRKAMVNQECQTYQFAGSKKPQMDTLIKEVESKVKVISDLHATVENIQKLLNSAEHERAILKEEKKKNEELIRHFSHNYETIEKEYTAYRVESELSLTQMRNLLYKKDQRVQEMKEQLEKMEKVKLPPPVAHKDAQTQLSRQTSESEMQTDTVIGEDQYNLTLLKEKQESLGRLNVLKELKIKRLQVYNNKLRDQLRTTFEQLSIDIDEEDLDLFIKKVEKIDTSEIRKRISIVADSFKYVTGPQPIHQTQSSVSSISDSKSIDKSPGKAEPETDTIAVQTQPIRIPEKKSIRLGKSQKNILATAKYLKMMDDTCAQTQVITTCERGVYAHIRISNSSCEKCLEMELFDQRSRALGINILERNVVNIKLYPMPRRETITRRHMYDVACQTNIAVLKENELVDSPRTVNNDKLKFKPKYQGGVNRTLRQVVRKKNAYHHDGRIRKIESFEDLPQLPLPDLSRHRTGNNKRPSKDCKEEFVGLAIDHAKTLPNSEEPQNVFRVLQKMRFTLEETDRVTRYLLQLEKSTNRRVDLKIEAQKMIRDLAIRHYANIQDCPHYPEIIHLLNRMI